MSKATIPMIAEVLPHFNSLNCDYCTITTNESLELWVRMATNHAHLELDKYYQAMDNSSMYHIAICRSKYFQSNFDYSTYMDEVFRSLVEEQDKPVDPITAFVKDKIVIKQWKSRSKCPVNPLAWWYAQHVARHEHDRLTQMAINILSTPASSIEVKHAFSFTTATLGAYSHVDLVLLGILVTAHKKVHEQAQAKAQAKAAEAKAQAAAAEAEALATEEGEKGRDEEEEAEEEDDQDDQDVLMPSSEFSFDEEVWDGG
ncbi:hypothetical protein FRC11_010143 [Ceratobasidium sp. 423]|nr:hypothetical protein FRC11_010143 [Ceratobasidium sp. 423]